MACFEQVLRGIILFLTTEKCIKLHSVTILIPRKKCKYKFKISNISNHKYGYVMCQEEQMKSTKLSLHILKFDASMSCESQTNVTKSFMKQILQIIKSQLYYLRLQYPVDLCMIIMLFLLCPYSSYRPWNPAVPGAPCR